MNESLKNKLNQEFNKLVSLQNQLFEALRKNDKIREKEIEIITSFKDALLGCEVESQINRFGLVMRCHSCNKVYENINDKENIVVNGECLMCEKLRVNCNEE